MHRNCYITKSKRQQAVAKGLELRPGHLYPPQHQPSFFGWATQQLGQSLPGKHGQQQVELGGYHATTTLDQRLQGLATHAVSSVLQTSSDPAASIVSID